MSLELDERKILQALETIIEWTNYAINAIKYPTIGLNVADLKRKISTVRCQVEYIESRLLVAEIMDACLTHIEDLSGKCDVGYYTSQQCIDQLLDLLKSYGRES